MERLNGGGILINLTNIIINDTDGYVDITDDEIRQSFIEISPIAKEKSYKNLIYIKADIVLGGYRHIYPCTYDVSSNNRQLHLYCLHYALGNNDIMFLRIYADYTWNERGEVTNLILQYSCSHASIFDSNINKIVIDEDLDNSAEITLLTRLAVAIEPNVALTNAKFTQLRTAFQTALKTTIVINGVVCPVLWFSYVNNTSFTLTYMESDGTIGSKTIGKTYQKAELTKHYY